MEAKKLLDKLETHTFGPSAHWQVHDFSLLTLPIYPVDDDYVYRAEQGLLAVKKYHDNHGFQVETWIFDV